MSLPKLETPTYELILPSTGEKIKYRPFLVKEYKILLTALESDGEEIHRIITELVDVCTFNKLKMDTLPNFDIELIFLNLRAKSVGESTNLTLQCNNCEKILISDKIGLEMRYPKFDEMIIIYQNFKSESVVELLCSCIKSVYTDEQLYDDYTKEELIEFVNSFSKNQFSMLEQFFVTMPKVVQHIEQDCPACGAHNELNLEGLQNFFV